MSGARHSIVAYLAQQASVDDSSLSESLLTFLFSAKWAKMKAKMQAVVEGPIVSTIMTLLTLWSLFDDDIRMYSTGPEADAGFTVVITIIFFVFWIDIFIACLYRNEYFQYPDIKKFSDPNPWVRINNFFTFGSFYFWTDILSTISLISEMDWISSDFADSSGNQSMSELVVFTLIRAARILRIVRIVKLYKYLAIRHERGKKEKAAAEQKSAQDEERAGSPDKPQVSPEQLLLANMRRQSVATLVTFEDVDSEEVNDLLEEELLIDEAAESHIGAAMSDITTRRVIVLVIFMVIIIPILNASPRSDAWQFSTDNIHQFCVKNYTSGGGFESDIYMALNVSIDELDLLKVVAGGVTIYKDAEILDNRRGVELVKLSATSYNVTSELWSFETEATFDHKYATRGNALMGILLTIFIILIFTFGTLVFNFDVNRLVIAPIEKMVKFVEYISKDPLGQSENFTSTSLENTEGMETILLLQTISKIASLMKVGFGEAGASTIAAVLKESNSDAINLVGPGNGKKIKSIFGFCDVRNFTDTTECLQEEVMLFVNRIAHVLHSIVVQCSGSANKNIGDAFLLTWKVDEKAKPGKTAALADQALLTFCLALIELSRHEDFIVDFSAQSMHRLNRRNLTKVRIGCGLHFGWAIEGAIGSAKKIDASYLSPHVGMSEFLESSTKAYGVPLLLSEPFYKLLSLSASKWIRQVDRIQRSEGEGPFGIYTYDADPEIDWAARDVIPRLVVKGPGGPKAGAPARGEHAMVKLRRSSTRTIDTSAFDKVPDDVATNAPVIKLDPYTPSIWERNRDLIALRHKIKDPFRVIWKEGIEHYIKGDWDKAMGVFNRTLDASQGQDGPTKFLVNFIQSHGGKAPADWKGFREE